MSPAPRANFPLPDSHSYSVLGQVGRQLAIIGDDINRRYDTEFQNLLEQLQPTAGNAYELFTKIASRYRHPPRTDVMGSLAGDSVGELRHNPHPSPGLRAPFTLLHTSSCL